MCLIKPNLRDIKNIRKLRKDSLKICKGNETMLYVLPLYVN